MNRREVNEILATRTAQVRERILRNLAFSPAHAYMTAPEREELADQLAKEAMTFDQPGYNNGLGVAPVTAWGPDDTEVKTDRFKTAMDYGNEDE